MTSRPSLAFAVVLSISSVGCGTASPAASSHQIQWEDWTPQAFARARAENRLLLVDVVAEWCHWCHVMDHTTYADAGVAGLLAADYVAIRVDSDARPDVAERYRDWGWPATAILTPDAQPVLELRGYQEPDEFRTLLRSTAESFRAGRPIARPPATRAPAATSDLDELRSHVAGKLAGYYDEEEEGWGRPQKYPLAAPVEHAFLVSSTDPMQLALDRQGWTRDLVSRQGRGLAAALDTLAKETRLLDPVWGGMYQYSTHGDWDHPHFEKIVPVQAGALSNFAQAYGATGDRRWLDAAANVKRYVRRFLTGPDGGFLTSQDADVRVDGVVTVDGHDFFPLDDAARRSKGMPRIDANVYADRNGLLVQALCELHDVARDDEALATARRAAERVVATHSVPSGGFTHGDVVSTGPSPLLHLADQVTMGRGMLALAQATGDAVWLTRATSLAATLADRFEDASVGAFWAHTLDEGAVGVFAARRKPFEENARAARFLLRLGEFTGDARWKASAERALRFFADPATLEDEGRAVGDYLLALEELIHPPVHLGVVGRRGAADTVALHAAALSTYAPGKVVKLSAPGDEYPDIGHAAVYVCTDKSCSSPVTDGSKLEDEIRNTLAVGK